MMSRPFSIRLRSVLLAAILAGALSATARAGEVPREVRVAVAANFLTAAREIGAAFEAETGHRAIVSHGSTGQLYVQIAQGAPYEVFLAADRDRPARAIDEGYAVPGSRFTYATGRLVLYGKDPALVRGPETLRADAFAHLAIANPAIAPYGVAAVEAMTALGLYEFLEDKIVRGTNIAQTYQFVETGNAELGFVALAQLAGREGGSRWLVPEALHAPIAQDAVLLNRGADNESARAFVAFLRGPTARAIKEKYGYGPGD
ncbi:MAG: molybdate ABC transporter substrate-binding protein [Rhodospirillaceae bacterium]|jgi:molybdate transport system substrate-binding protein|nr:molybdate ABC transporter substrate-binding protein [Rhodospirillaceae bacterium]